MPTRNAKKRGRYQTPAPREKPSAEGTTAVDLVFECHGLPPGFGPWLRQAGRDDSAIQLAQAIATMTAEWKWLLAGGDRALPLWQCVDALKKIAPDADRVLTALLALQELRRINQSIADSGAIKQAIADIEDVDVVLSEIDDAAEYRISEGSLFVERDVDAVVALDVLTRACDTLARLLPRPEMPSTLRRIVVEHGAADGRPATIPTLLNKLSDLRMHAAKVLDSGGATVSRYRLRGLRSPLWSLYQELIPGTWDASRQWESRDSSLPEQRMVCCEVLTNFGSFVPGDVIEVGENEVRTALASATPHLRVLDPADVPRGAAPQQHRAPGNGRPRDVANVRAMRILEIGRCSDPGRLLAALLHASGDERGSFRSIVRRLCQLWRELHTDRAAAARSAPRPVSLRRPVAE